MRCRKDNLGFTLLEIVVSIAILGMMAVMAAYVFTASNRAVDQGKDQALIDETARLVLDYIEQDISQALIRTNVAFRVGETGTVNNNTLYFVSTGMRRQLEGILRDTAPMRVQVGSTGLWNLWLTIESPSKGTRPRHIDDIARYSDYYYTSTNQVVGDFMAVANDGEEITVKGVEYTHEPQSGLSDHAVLSSLRIVVNGDPNWGMGNEGLPPDAADMPRFVDVSIGLLPVAAVEHADRLSDAGSIMLADEHLVKNEQIFSRRIFMRNTGTTTLDFD